jgi:hypothetical protein
MQAHVSWAQNREVRKAMSNPMEYGGAPEYGAPEGSAPEYGAPEGSAPEYGAPSQPAPAPADNPISDVVGGLTSAVEDGVGGLIEDGADVLGDIF